MPHTAFGNFNTERPLINANSDAYPKKIQRTAFGIIQTRELPPISAVMIRPEGHYGCVVPDTTPVERTPIEETIASSSPRVACELIDITQEIRNQGDFVEATKSNVREWRAQANTPQPPKNSL